MWALLSIVVARRLQLDSSAYGVMLSWLGAGAVTGAFTTGRINRQFTVNQRILIAIFMFIATNLSLAFFPAVYWLYPVMFLSGMAWLMVMTSFNTTVQLNLPKWVQARVLSIYMLVFQGGMALGSVAWGTLADHFNLGIALAAAAAWLLISALLAIPFPISPAENLNLTPAEHWPEPAVQGEIDPDDGPVVVMVEYQVKASDIPAFRLAVDQLIRLRLRDGALRAGVFADVTNPTRITEFFYVATWGEHQRQHHRFTQEDLAIETRVIQFHSDATPPKVTHYIAFPKAPNVYIASPFENMEGHS